MWRHLFVRTENSEIQLLISEHKDGNQALNSSIFRAQGRKIAKFSCKFPSVRTENSELLHLISIPTDGK